MNRIEKVGKCNSCKGTGIYCGMAEIKNVGVVCRSCKGRGRQTYVLEWEDFEGLETREDVSRVLQCNPGVGVTGDAEFGGMPYTDWLEGKPFPLGSEMRQFTCPAWWCQSAGLYDRFDKSECGFGMFSGCDHFPQKHLCWETFDKQGATP